MAIKLTKGERISLKKEAPNLKRVLVGLGWDPEKGFFNLHDIDIDASIICIDKNNEKVETVYYGNLQSHNGAIKHYGDNLTGEGDGDDEQIEINLEAIPKQITRLSIIINIYHAYERKQHFGKVKNCFVHVDDIDTGNKLVSYDIDGDFDKKTGIFVADLYKTDGEWKFQAIGEGVKVADIAEMERIKCN